jgi:hypothetical protein
MDRRVALELLALEPDAPLTHDRLRRAYLRRLRVFSPERDPDGFRRLREAYEWLEQQAHMALFRAMLEERAAEAEAEAEATKLGESASIDPASGEPVAIEPADSVSVEPASIAATSGEPVATVEPASVETSRVEPFAAADPASIEPAAPQDAHAASTGDSDPVTLAAVTEEILSLLQRGDINAALDLRDRWNRSAIDDHREVHDYTARRWALARELLEVAPALSSLLCTEIARAIAANELSSAHDAVRLFAIRTPHRASDLVKHMAKRAPNLHHAFRQPLARAQQRASDDRDGSGKGSGRSPWGAVILILVVSAFLRRTSACNDRPAQPAQPERALPTPSELHLRTPPQLKTDRATEPSDALIRLEQIERIRQRLEQRNLQRPDGSAASPPTSPPTSPPASPPASPMIIDDRPR